MKLKNFQKQDLARAALHDGLIHAWDTGLGKTWALYLLQLLKVGYTVVTDQHGRRFIQPKAPCLIIAPGDLHKQIADEGWAQFKVRVTPIETQADFNRLCQKGFNGMPQLSAEGRPLLPPGFYITSFSQLTQNGVQSLPDADKWDPHSLLETLALSVGDAQVIPPLDRLEPFQDSHEWPDLVVDFFELRSTNRLWSDEYETFRLDYRHHNQADLEKRYATELAALANWRDRKLAAAEAKRLAAAHGLLVNLLPVRIGNPRLGCTFADLAPAQHTWVIREFCRHKLTSYEIGNGTAVSYPIGEPPPGFIASMPETDTRAKWRIKCLYSPSLADLSYNAFDSIAIDEGVRMKGEDTLVGKGIRSMDPLYRIVCTATPVKNRLPDIFRLAWWATGGRLDAHARFPYRDDSSEREQFSRTFLVCERNISKEEKSKAVGGNTKYRKQTAEVCNIHRLWKLLGPIVMRRRKQDCGEDIVPRVRHVVRCDMGTLQRQVYAYHLKADYRDINDEKAIGAQLQALRMAAADPSSVHLLDKPGETTEPCPCTRKKAGAVLSIPSTKSTPATRCARCGGSGQLQLPARSGSAYIPKLAVTLQLIRDILERKEQVMVFSAFNDPNDNLSRMLAEAGVRHSLLDGRTNQKKRATAASIFKQGRTAADGPSAVPVMLAGVECMAEGHSFHRCNNVILIAYSWAYDKFKQALDRVHRMNSEKPVNVYVVLCSGTIDRKLESLVQEKGDAAELVLDGRLMGERAEEVNFAELLQVAREEFNPDEKTVDEGLLQSEWPQLRHSLRCAQAAWDASIPALPVHLQTPARRALPEPEPVAELELLIACRAEAPSAGGSTPSTPSTPTPALPDAWRNRLRDRAERLRQLANNQLAVLL